MPLNRIWKYVRKMLLALVVFGIPLTLAGVYMDTGAFNGGIVKVSLLHWIAGTGIRHYWFLYAMIGVYLIMPVLKAFYEHVDRKTVAYIIAVIIAFDFVIPVIVEMTGVSVGITIELGYVIAYLLLGRFLADGNLAVTKGMVLTVAAGTFAVEIILVAMGNDDLFFRYSSPLILLQAAAVFLAFRGYKTALCEILWKIDRLCFGVYLIHPFPMHAVYKILKITPMRFGNTAIGLIMLLPVFVLMAFLISWGMSRVSVLRRYVL